LNEVLVCGEEPDKLAEKCSGYTDQPATRDGDQFVVDLGHSKIVVVDPVGLDRLVPGYRAPVASSLAGFTVATADLDQTRTFLVNQEIGFHEAALQFSVHTVRL
jgi:hypothetical protein